MKKHNGGYNDDDDAGDQNMRTNTKHTTRKIKTQMRIRKRIQRTNK